MKRRGETTKLPLWQLDKRKHRVGLPAAPDQPIDPGLCSFTCVVNRTHACAMTSHMSLGVTVSARRNCPSSFFELDLLKQ
jgi:hypothetical protein